MVVLVVGICSRYFRYPVCLEGRKGRSGNDTGEVVIDFFFLVKGLKGLERCAKEVRFFICSTF